MKTKHVLLTIVVTALLASCSCSFKNNTTVDGTKKDTIEINSERAVLATNCATINAPLPAEDQLRMGPFKILASDAKGFIENTKQLFYFGTPTSTLSYNLATITETALIEFQSQAPVSAPDCTNTITGVRMFFAMETGKMKLFYRPVLLRRTALSVKEGTYSVVEGADYYTYTNDAFKKITPADGIDVQKSIDNYTASIYIREPGAPTRTFNPAMDITGDTRSVIFPFQEMIALIDANQTQSLYVWNGYKTVNANPPTRHSLFLSPRNVLTLPQDSLISPKIRICSLVQNYADLGHLCPPSCGSVACTLR